MKTILLTENQYICIIVDNFYNNTMLNSINESKESLKKFSYLLFKDCKKKSDYVRRVKKAIAMGVSIAVISTLLNISFNGEKDKTEEIINDSNIENTVKPKENSMLSKSYANGFNISEDGIRHIKQYEKCSLTPYYATEYEKINGIKTIGWGHKIINSDPSWLKEAKSITQEQADELFLNDIKIYEGEVKRLFKSEIPKKLQDPTLYPQSTMDVFISMIYNCGFRNLKNSDFIQTLKKCRIDSDTNKLNEEDFYFACSKIRNSCVTQNGKTLKGLQIRRNEECLMAQR